MSSIEQNEFKIQHAIDDISNSVSINGCESNTTEFLLNFLTDQVPNIAKLMLENECNEADAADMDNMESNPEDDIHNVD